MTIAVREVLTFDGSPTKMMHVAVKAHEAIVGLVPFLSVVSSDNLMSCVAIRGSLQDRSQWSNGIFHNSPYFIVFINPAKDARWYDPEVNPQVTLELTSKGQKVAKLRKFTGSPEKVIEKLRAWIVAQVGTPLIDLL